MSLGPWPFVSERRNQVKLTWIHLCQQYQCYARKPSKLIWQIVCCVQWSKWICQQCSNSILVTLLCSQDTRARESGQDDQAEAALCCCQEKHFTTVHLILWCDECNVDTFKKLAQIRLCLCIDQGCQTQIQATTSFYLAHKNVQRQS